MGHAFSENISAGFTLSKGLRRNLPDSFKKSSSNFGGGVWVQWTNPLQDGNWYLRGSAAGNHYDVDRSRKGLANTESGSGDSRMKGYLFGLEAGRDMAVSDQAVLGYYGGLRRTSVSVDGYSESVPGFPFTYSSSRYTATSAYAGVRYTRQLTDKVKWATTAEIEQDLSRKDPSLTARAEYFGSQTFHGDFAKTRGSLSTALSYGFSDAVNLTFSPYVERTATRDTAYGAALRLSGTF